MFHLCTFRIRSSRVGLHPWFSSGSPSSVVHLRQKRPKLGMILIANVQQYWGSGMVYCWVCHSITWICIYIYICNIALSLYVLNKPACMGLTARRLMELHWGPLMAPTWLVCYTPHWERHGATDMTGVFWACLLPKSCPKQSYPSGNLGPLICDTDIVYTSAYVQPTPVL